MYKNLNFKSQLKIKFELRKLRELKKSEDFDEIFQTFKVFSEI